MGSITPEFLLQLIMALGAPVAVYAGIKSDLATTRLQADNAKESAANAHARIDSLLQKD